MSINTQSLVIKDRFLNAVEAEKALPLERPVRINLIQKFIDST